jgi:phenylpyruvate tautomerase PptA (4-oxalocrotonate tautomerase family)
MPLIQLHTSTILSDQKKKSLAKALSQLAAEITKKPEQYVMACIHDNLTMTMSGSSEACALVAIKAIGGLSKPVNQNFAARASELIEKELNIPASRIYLTFEELPPTHWAWEGETFG